MRLCTSIERVLLVLMLPSLYMCAVRVPANHTREDGDGLPGVVVFPGHTPSVDCYCVPNLIAIPGRLVAITEARILNCDDSAAKTIATKASDDGGVTWQPEVAIVENSSFTNSGAAVWDNHTQALLVTYATNGPCAACPWDTCKPPICDCNSGCRNIWLARSTDKGRSFSKGRNISDAIWNHPRTCSGGSKCVYGEFLNPGPTKGVQLADGTLVFVVVDITSQVPGMPGGGIVSIRSTDFGMSWLAGKPRWVPGWSETTIVHLGGDRLLANGRCSDPKTCGDGAIASRYFAVSEDSGLSWGMSTTLARTGVRGAICDGDMVMLGNRTLLFSHPAGLSHMDDTASNGTFRGGDCFTYPHQVPGKKCAAVKDCPFSVDAPCRSNLTILSSTNEGQNWQPWASGFWPGYTDYPWVGGGSTHFPQRAGYSSIVHIRSEDSASAQDEVAVLFESVGTMGPLRLIRFSMDGKVLKSLKTDDGLGEPRYPMYYTLGNPAWSPEWSSTKPLPGPPPYNVSRYGLRTGRVITFDVSSGSPSPWPRIIRVDRGPDGKPCAGPSAEPCYNYTWAPESCAKAGGVKTETVWGAICCAAGGCAPQDGNASAVGQMVHRLVQEKVPVDFTGNCVLDVEGWNALTTDTTFGTCDTMAIADGPELHPNLYRNYSLAVVQQQHPSLSPAQAIAQARRAYHQAASTILVTALRAARAARPTCKWGYYGEMAACSLRGPCTEPGANGSDPLCGYDHPVEGPALRRIAEQHRPVWDESDQLYPSIYFSGIQPSGSVKSYACMNAHFRGPSCRNFSLAQNRALIHSTIAQALRSAAPTMSNDLAGKPVLPYMWQYCDSLFPCYQNSTFSLTRWGLETSMRLPYDLGASGLVIWVDSEESKRLPELERLVAMETGPLASALLDSVATCAMRQCSGHGRCRTLPTLPPPPPLPPPPLPPPPPGCLKSCSLTPCGECATGCPTNNNSKVCKMPDGRAASKNECLCNADKSPCRGNLTLCPPPPATLKRHVISTAVPQQCTCDVGWTGTRCERRSLYSHLLHEPTWVL